MELRKCIRKVWFDYWQLVVQYVKQKKLLKNELTWVLFDIKEIIGKKNDWQGAI